MEKSAGKIKYDKDSITEIAMDSGYETPQAFLLLLKKSLWNPQSNIEKPTNMKMKN